MERPKWGMFRVSPLFAAMRGLRPQVAQNAAGQTKTVFPSLCTDRGLPSSVEDGGRPTEIQGCGPFAVLRLLDRIKRMKGVWWMPWR